MKILTTIILMTITLFSKSTFGQTESSFDSFICNEWYLVKCAFVDPEQEVLSDVVNREYKMIFYRDHKVKTNFSVKRQFGVWVYTPDAKQLTITYNETNEIVTMKVFKLSESSMILDYTDENGIQLSLWMDLDPLPLFID
jgi:hypothetical protein